VQILCGPKRTSREKRPDSDESLQGRPDIKSSLSIHFRIHAATMTDTATTFYDHMGGAPAVRKLVDRFYELMDTLPRPTASASCTRPT
jgi:hypothetical protein